MIEVFESIFREPSLYQTTPGVSRPPSLVVNDLRPSDQTHPVAKLPFVEGLWPSDHTNKLLHKNNQCIRYLIHSLHRPGTKKYRCVKMMQYLGM